MYSLSIVCAVMLIYSSLYIKNVDGKCLWLINEDLPQNHGPVYARTASSRLLVPNSGYIELNNYENLNISCPGHNNGIIFNYRDYNMTTVIGSCAGGKQIKLRGQLTDLKNIQCRKNPKAVARIDANDIFRIGFDVGARFFEIIRVKYNFQEHKPVHTEHVIHGKAFKGYNDRTEKHQEFRAEIDSSVNWSAIFKPARVYRDVLAPQLGARAARYNATYLARGHLAPTADFIFQAWKRATYFYENVVPQWQHINNGCWKSLENAIRNVAKDYDDDLKVYTGGSGVLRLATGAALVPVYLDGYGRVPVPEYIWKVVCSRTNLCIGFVVFNHPDVIDGGVRCRNVCAAAGWHRASFDDNGKIICCDVNDLRSNLGILPELHSVGLLTAGDGRGAGAHVKRRPSNTYIHRRNAKRQTETINLL